MMAIHLSTASQKMLRLYPSFCIFINYSLLKHLSKWICQHIDLIIITPFFFFYQAALDHLVNREDIDTSRIIIFGRSLGGAVGTVLARNNPDKVSLFVVFSRKCIYTKIPIWY